MYAQSHDNGYSKHREMQLPFMFMREGIADIYSDGWRQSSTCKECGGEFPRNAYANYLGEFSDNSMPELVTLHNNLARGLTHGRWSDQYIAAWDRYDNREGGAIADQTVMLFAINGNFGLISKIASQSDVKKPVNPNVCRASRSIR